MTPPPGPRFTRLVSADVCHIDILDFKRAEVCPFSSVPRASRPGRSLVGKEERRAFVSWLLAMAFVAFALGNGRLSCQRGSKPSTRNTYCSTCKLASRQFPGLRDRLNLRLVWGRRSRIGCARATTRVSSLCLSVTLVTLRRTYYCWRDDTTALLISVTLPTS